MIDISTPYETDPTVVFVDAPRGSDVDWLSIPADQAQPDEIIHCVFCDKPAITLDHYYPYYSKYNRCEEHIGACGNGWHLAGRRWHYFREGRSICWNWEISVTAPLASFEALPQGMPCAHCKRRLPKEAKP